MPRPRTPRKLRVTVDIDVTEGPRLRRGTTADDLLEKLGVPVRGYAVKLANAAFNLDAEKASVQVTWGYEWMNASEESLFYQGDEMADYDEVEPIAAD